MSVSIRSEVEAVLDRYTAVISSLIDAITRQSHRRGAGVAEEDAVVQLMQEVLKVDREMQNVAAKLNEHQTFQRKIQHTLARIQRTDASIVGLAQKLHSTSEKLQMVVDTAEEALEAWRTAREKPIVASDLLRYAALISSTTSAPTGWQPGQPLMHLHRPPAPQDDQIRAGLLFKWSLERGMTSMAKAEDEILVNIDPAMDEDDKPAPGAEPSGPVQLGIGLSDDEEADDDDVVWD